jgi:hypothetical protein
VCSLDYLNWGSTATSQFKCLVSPPANASSLLYTMPIVITVVDSQNENQTVVVPSQDKFSRFTWRTNVPLLLLLLCELALTLGC